METYLELPHMLPIKVYSSSAGDQVWIEQPRADDDEPPDQVLIHRDHVKDVIDALKRYLRDLDDAAKESMHARIAELSAQVQP